MRISLSNLGDCVVGATDPTTGDTIASCPSTGATCPSLAQMQGIVDPSDPCQALTLTSAQCGAGTVATQGPSGNGWVCSPTAGTTSTCPTGSTCSIVPGIPNTNIYLAVGAVIGLFAFVSMHK